MPHYPPRAPDQTDSQYAQSQRNYIARRVREQRRAYQHEKLHLKMQHTNMRLYITLMQTPAKPTPA